MAQLAIETDTEEPKGTLVTREFQLHRRITQRDKAALLECFDLIGRFVYCHALYETGSSAAAEALTERVFVALWLEPHEFDPARGPVALQLVRRLVQPSASSRDDD